MIEEKIAELLAERGPLTGGELHEALRIDRFELWRECLRGPGFLMRSLGRRYMRLDDRLSGFARLSPSILREFLTYTAVALDSQIAALGNRLGGMAARIAEISEYKTRVARALADKVMALAADSGHPRSPVSFLLAGDIAYGMAHEEPRPERSTGRIVRGSDIDLVLLSDDTATDGFLSALDAAMHREKYLILTDPRLNQEIDYVVKRLSRAREQMAFDGFKRMIACKIMDESLFLAGDPGPFDEMKRLLAESGTAARLAALRSKAEEERSQAVELLSNAPSLEPGDALANLFYSSDESEEFE